MGYIAWIIAWLKNKKCYLHGKYSTRYCHYPPLRQCQKMLVDNLKFQKNRNLIGKRKVGKLA